jgi:N-acetylglucosamine-6-phosphate deacetylase
LKNKGRLEFGCDADLVLLDEELAVLKTFIAGEEVFSV